MRLGFRLLCATGVRGLLLRRILNRNRNTDKINRDYFSSDCDSLRSDHERSGRGCTGVPIGPERRRPGARALHKRDRERIGLAPHRLKVAVVFLRFHAIAAPLVDLRAAQVRRRREHQLEQRTVRDGRLQRERSRAMSV